MTLTPETLHRLLAYDSSTGHLFWRERPIEMFAVPHVSIAWNAQWTGKRALKGVTEDGYLHGRIFDRYYLAHRVAWAMSTGYWPENDIDHRNLDKADNRLTNLREATRSQNQQNKAKTCRNKSGVKGVYFIPRLDKWGAKIGKDGKVVFLGCFREKTDAADAYARASAEMHREFGRTV